MKITHLFPLLALAGVAIGCKTPKEDLEAPVIQAFSVNGETAEVEIAVGGAINYSANLTDNENLKQFKIDLHDGFDGHGHNKVTTYPAYSYSNIGDIEGTTYQLTLAATVPTTVAAGPYHIQLRALDESGNESPMQEIDLILTRADQAVVNVTNFDLSQTNTAAIGGRLTLAGAVTDDIDVAEVQISLVGISGSVEGVTAYTHDFDLAGTTDTNWDLAEIENLGFPIDLTGVAAGEYELFIYVSDSDGNYTVKEGVFQVQ